MIGWVEHTLALTDPGEPPQYKSMIQGNTLSDNRH